jgi:hypothetical protein
MPYIHRTSNQHRGEENYLKEKCTRECFFRIAPEHEEENAEQEVVETEGGEAAEFL